ncbi:ubiquinone biosynthesis protein COQ11 KNAG_0F03150 [Huiozyma naganishii CBS 8797]|uniref:NAD-dependent epimerase/dehydratase domain-containing protein n=1 Tax=Huiozyma naganishii (strain ATCC MYA-139 / BCRC 22969 / CBS 8797 / KCTC 17520 / NBRC 10181 / NCYC 3082 / Yp74L-3) TaxID=1071383 RepID=J7S0G5_HUIN7|nr:hypothetical protein KNAG_0F03150 [Kazachstania naganishii CBS 8797]CCK70977.1 hypothetical protein KNAG_0F03150 [Kazachstania naganishii CBS 8797]
MVAAHLVVFGGNGFLGRRICQQALKSGFQVTALSRSGLAPRSQRRGDERWVQQVNWRSADVFEPESYKQHLQTATHVVHSLGILLEKESYKSILANPLSKLMGSNSNPLLYPRKDTTENPGFTYERMNKQSAVILAEAFAKTLQNTRHRLPMPPTFSYISADRWSPLVPAGYIDSKRAAETLLTKFENSFRPIFMRPGFMFDETTKYSLNLRTCLADISSTLNCANKLILRERFNALNKSIRPVVSTQRVASCLMEKIYDPKFNGVVTLTEMTS